MIEEYEENNKTYTMNSEQMAYYVMDYDEIEISNNGTTRLLLNPDGSLTLINFDKRVRILKTNVIGFVIGLYAYTEINLKLFEDQVNPHKKIPRLNSEVGVILVLGSS